MNLKEFTEQVDRCAQSLSQEELRGFLHNFARKVPEKEREEFLELLRLAGETARREIRSRRRQRRSVASVRNMSGCWSCSARSRRENGS
mgnify:CR=1 FL=1